MIAAVSPILATTLLIVAVLTSPLRAAAARPPQDLSPAPAGPILRHDGGLTIVTPPLASGVVLNPGKGWVAYGSAKGQPREVLELVSLGYTRYRWGNLEPQEGVFNWEIIDRDIEAWAAVGKEFAFGVACASSHSNDFWVTPKWVFDAGAKYDSFDLQDPKLRTTGTPGKKLVPVFDDPIFLAKLERFVRAMAARYDGHPRVAFIDIRSYGNWGEAHMHPFRQPDIAPADFRRHLQMHRDAFRQTRLVVPGGNRKFEPLFDWAVSVGIGMRRDGICGNSDGRETLRCDGIMPGVFELFGHYDMLRDLGWWDGRKDNKGYGHRLEDCVERGKPTYCDLSRGGKSGLELLKAEPALVARLANRLGYHLVLREARYPTTLDNKRTHPVRLTWENRGVARMFVPARVSFALLDSRDQVVAVCDATASRPADWKSDSSTTVEDLVQFRSAPAGTYRLALGLRLPADNLKPTIKLGSTLECHDGWHVLGPVLLAAGAP
jgi:hypothetical protein